MDERRVKDVKFKVFVPVEMLLKKIIVVLVFLLVTSQLLLLNPLTRQYVSIIDKLEGEKVTTIEALPASQIHNNQQWLELILLEDFPRSEISIYINGVKYSNFHDLQMRIPVADQQSVSVTVDGIPGIFSIQIIDSSHDMIEYMPGKIFEVSENSPLQLEF
ncbi:hypothetical protein [Desulfuribacillus alkaliarsenatis]|uniref:Uncharacterized protein n=1 Tax=Desulfuribacillus alkaliarsenatis TaxID=766136 RepID=A0A1E5G0Q8_9FIRM|nr:hypothetical protein [Desulfuribacillus alkaliarsenatis]OEF96028.1 hypothetical protein BHF68_09790 [Desulfuribacillus alkaliarsenatis]